MASLEARLDRLGRLQPPEPEPPIEIVTVWSDQWEPEPGPVRAPGTVRITRIVAVLPAELRDVTE